MSTCAETIREWYEQGQSMSQIAKKLGHPLKFVEQCIRATEGPKFTPGPWRNDPQIGCTFGLDGKAIQTGGASCSEETRGNARLIAKAPEMFKLVKWLSEGYGAPSRAVQEEALAIVSEVEEGSE